MKVRRGTQLTVIEVVGDPGTISEPTPMAWAFHLSSRAL